MPAGPGKFDLLCTYVREKAGAEGAAVIVISTDAANAGFSVQCPRALYKALASVFRHVATEIEREFDSQGGEDPEPPAAS